MSRALQVGDVLAYTTGATSYLYVVTGFSPRGKTVMRRAWSGTEFTAWWPTEASLPKHYRVHTRARSQEAA